MSTKPDVSTSVTPPEPALRQVQEWLGMIKDELRALQHPFPALRQELQQSSKILTQLADHLQAVAELVKAGPPPMPGEMVARPDPYRQADDLPEGCPHEVWTLHLVPGRLSDLPLAVRRRVLSISTGGYLNVELPRGTLGVDAKVMKQHGRSRTDGICMVAKDGHEPLLWVYLNCPDEEERLAWREQRQRERELLARRTLTFWVTVPNFILGAPDIAVRCTGKRRRDMPGGINEFDLRTSTTAKWFSRGRQHQAEVELFPLFDDGYWSDDEGEGDILCFFREPPSQAELQHMGRERARRVREQESRAQSYWARQHTQGPSMGTPFSESVTGSDALRALGLDTRSSVDDIRRAFGKKIYEQRAHPDQGGTHEQILWWGRLRDAALKALLS